MQIELGQTASVVRMVSDADTATVVGSGDLSVLATPILLAWLESATIEVCPATDGETTVGTRISLDHVRPSAVGAEVTCHATVGDIDANRITFKVEATQRHNGKDVLVGRGVVVRTIVGREKFLAKLDRRATDRSSREGT